MDMCGDKHCPYLPYSQEQNPFCGYRAIRISLYRQDIFRTQLRACCRASALCNYWIMFPKLSTMSEFKQAKQILLVEKEKLVKDGE